MKGVDSAARFSAKAAKDAGYSIGARYINQSFNKAELADYQANGLTLLPIYEENGKPGNFADGARQGTNAKRILEGLGLSGWGCVFTDDVSGASLSTCREWARGIRSTFPWHFVYYGPAHIIDALGDEGLIDSGWIEGAYSYSAGWRPGGPKPSSRHACGIQFPPPYVYVGSVECDYNEFDKAPWVPGQGNTTKDWFDMATKDELKDAVREVMKEDEVKSGIGKKAAYWLGTARLQGQDMSEISVDLVTVLKDVLDQLDPNRGQIGAVPGGITIRALVENTNNVVSAIKGKLGN